MPGSWAIFFSGDRFRDNLSFSIPITVTRHALSAACVSAHRTLAAPWRWKMRRDHKSRSGKQISALSLTGGTLAFLDQICHLATLAGSCGIKYIRTGTNGYLFRYSGQTDFSDRMKRLADQLAATPIRNIWVSIDSADAATHEKMRGLPGMIKGLEKALPILPNVDCTCQRTSGLTAILPAIKKSQSLRLRFFYFGFERFYRFVRELGFTIANVCYPMHSSDDGSENAVYAATANDRVVYFSHVEKLSLFQALSDCIPTQRGKIRIFTPAAVFTLFTTVPRTS